MLVIGILLYGFVEKLHVSFLHLNIMCLLSRRPIVGDISVVEKTVHSGDHLIIQNRKCMHNVTLRHICATIFAVERAINITYSECEFIALGIQHAKCMHSIVIYGLAGCTTLFHIAS